MNLEIYMTMMNLGSQLLCFFEFVITNILYHNKNVGSELINMFVVKRRILLLFTVNLV